MTFPDDCSEWLFRMLPNDWFGLLFQINISDACSDDFFGWLFVIPLLIRILATNSYFHGRSLFQAIIRLIGPTTDSILNDGFLLQNHGPDPPWYISDALTFCEKTIEIASLDIKETQKELNNKLENEESEEINTTLRKNDEINRKHLQERNNKKFTYLKFKPIRPITETTEFE